ncbi:MAG: PAS domain S-box protein [Thermoplasmatota archaeon]
MDRREATFNSILNLLKNTKKKMTITEISRNIGINRNSCAKYLDLLHMSGKVDMDHLGKAKLFYISQRVPISALLDFSSDLILVLDSSLKIVEVNDNLISLFRFKKDMLIDNKLSNTGIPFLNDREHIKLLRKAVKGEESTLECGIELEDGPRYFKIRLIPSTLGYGNMGVTVIMEDITDQTLSRNKLKESEEKYRELIQNQGEGVGITDREDRFVFANPAAERFLGLEEGDLIGKRVADFVVSEDRRKVNGYTEKRKMGHKDSYVLNVRSADGKKKKLLLTATPRYDEQGEYNGSFGVFRDITAMVESEMKLRESEERYRTLFNSSPDAILMMKDRTFIYCNRSTLRTFGATSFDDIKGRTPEDLSPRIQINGERTKVVQNRYIKEVLENGSKDFEWLHRRLDGSVFNTFVRLNRIEIGGETLLQATVRDITELKKAQDELRSEESRIRNILSSLHGSFIGLVRKDLIFEDFWGTSELDKKYGVRDNSDLKGMSILEFAPPEDHEGIKRKLDLCFRTGEPFSVEHRAVLPAGRFWQEWSFSPYRNEENEIEYLIQFGVDTQDKNEILQSLKRSEERSRNILSSLHDSFIGLIGRDHRFEDFWGSEELDDKYGIRASEMVGSDMNSFSPPGHEMEFTAVVDNIFVTADPITIEVPAYLPAGRFWQTLTLSPFLDGDGRVQYVIMYGMDTTEKNQLLEKLKITEERYGLLDDNSSDVIWMADKEMNYTYVSSSSAKLTGYRPDELIGKSIMYGIPGPTLKELESNLGREIEDFLSEKNKEYPRKNLELVLSRKDGREITCELNINTIRDKEGRPIGLMGITRDISDRKRSWRELERRERILEAVDRISGELLAKEIDEGSVLDALEILGKAMEVSRVYVFRNTNIEDGRVLTSQVLEWTDDDTEPQMNNPDLRDFDMVKGGFTRWIEELSNRRTIKGSVKEMSPEEQRVLAPQGIVSILVTPIFKGDKWWGFMGLDECGNERKWPIIDVRALRTVSHILGHILDKGDPKISLYPQEG